METHSPSYLWCSKHCSIPTDVPFLGKLSKDSLYIGTQAWCPFREREAAAVGFSLNQNRKLLVARTALVVLLDLKSWCKTAFLKIWIVLQRNKQPLGASLTWIFLWFWSTGPHSGDSRPDETQVVSSSLLDKSYSGGQACLSRSVQRTSACLGLQWLQTFLCHGEESVNTAETNRIRAYTEVHMHTNTKAYIAHYPDCTHPYKAQQKIEKGKKTA